MEPTPREILLLHIEALVLDPSDLSWKEIKPTPRGFSQNHGVGSWLVKNAAIDERIDGFALKRRELV
jgi:hypothetical protein